MHTEGLQSEFGGTVVDLGRSREARGRSPVGSENVTMLQSEEHAIEFSKRVQDMAIASCQRARSVVDGYYVRSRNAFAITATVFVAGQAAVLSNATKTENGSRVISGGEWITVSALAAVAGLCLLAALVHLFFRSDATKETELITGDSLDGLLDNEESGPAPFESAALEAIRELRGIEQTVSDRRSDFRTLSGLCVLTVLAVIAEVASLFVVIQ